MRRYCEYAGTLSVIKKKKMKKAILIILAIGLNWTILTCQNETNFPDEIKTEISDNHIRVKGSNAYLSIPTEYEYIESLSRFQKNDKLYIQIINFPTPYEEAKRGFSKEYIESRGAKVDIEKSININGSEAKYLEGPSKYSGESKIILLLGNNKNSIFLGGVYKNVDQEGKAELQQIMQTVYLNSKEELNSLELANFTFDQDITSFKFNTSASNMFIFTPKGDEISDEIDVPSFTISSFPKMTPQKSKDFAKDMIWRMETVGEAKLDSKEILPIKINGKDAYVLETGIEREGRKGWINMTIINEENSSLIFMGDTYSDIENYKNKFRATIKTLEEKK